MNKSWIATANEALTDYVIRGASHLSDEYISYERIQRMSEKDYKRLTGKFIADCMAGEMTAVSAVLWLRYIRDPIHGLGHRKLFRYILKQAATVEDPRFQAMPIILHECQYVWRPDDLLVLLDTGYEEWLKQYLSANLDADMQSYGANEPISSVSKWLPSINSHSPETRALAKKVCQLLHMSEREYRKMLSTLRFHGKVIERYLSDKNIIRIFNMWIVPRLASKRYPNYTENDRRTLYRRKAFIATLEDRPWVSLKYLYPHQLFYMNDDADWWLTAVKRWHAARQTMAASTIAVVRSEDTYVPTLRNSAIDIAYAWAGCFATSISNNMNGYMILARLLNVSSILRKASDITQMRHHMYFEDHYVDSIEEVCNMYFELWDWLKRHPSAATPKRILIITCRDTHNDWTNPHWYPWWLNMRKRFNDIGRVIPRLHIWDMWDWDLEGKPVRPIIGVEVPPRPYIETIAEMCKPEDPDYRDQITIYNGTDEVLMNMMILGFESYGQYYVGYATDYPMSEREKEIRTATYRSIGF